MYGEVVILDVFDDSLSLSTGIFLVAALVIIFAGTQLTALADELADRTGIGFESVLVLITYATGIVLLVFSN